jgi:hypothetical protein
LGLVIATALLGVGLASMLAGGWAIVTARTPGWVRLARVPAVHYTRIWGVAALLLGVGAILVVTSFSSDSLQPAGLFGLGLQGLAAVIWFYIRSRRGFIDR